MCADDHEILSKLAELDKKIAALDGVFVTRHEFESRMERHATEVLRAVSANMQAMVKDAMKSGMEELFTTLFNEAQERQRAERREDFKQMFGNMHKSVVWVQPILLTLLAVLSLYAFWFR